MRMGNGTANGLKLLAIGGLIGAGTALLLAPQSGRRTRRDLLHMGKVARNESERMFLDVGRRTSDMVDDLSEWLQDQAHKSRHLAEKAKNAVESGKEYFQRKWA